MDIGAKMVDELKIVRYVAELSSKSVGTEQMQRKGGNRNKGNSNRFATSEAFSHEKLAILVVTNSRLALFKEHP